MRRTIQCKKNTYVGIGKTVTGKDIDVLVVDVKSSSDTFKLPETYLEPILKEKIYSRGSKSIDKTEVKIISL